MPPAQTTNTDISAITPKIRQLIEATLKDAGIPATPENVAKKYEIVRAIVRFEIESYPDEDTSLLHHKTIDGQAA